MKAVVYHGPRNVSVDEVPDAKIEKPTNRRAADSRIRGLRESPRSVRMILDFYPERTVGDSQRRVSTRARGQVQNAGDDHWEMSCCTSD